MPDIQELYRRYGGLVLRRVRRFYASEEANDVVHEVFCRAIEKQDTFRGESSAGTWLFRLTTRYCLNRLRDQKRRRELLDAQGDLGWWAPSTDTANQERVAMTRELWAELDEELALVGIYYHVDGMSQAEIAEVLAVSRRTVGNRLEALETLLRARVQR